MTLQLRLLGRIVAGCKVVTCNDSIMLKKIAVSDAQSALPERLNNNFDQELIQAGEGDVHA